MNVAVFVVVLYVTAPAIAVPALVAIVKEIVLNCTASLNVAVGVDDMATPVAPAAGVYKLTDGCSGSVVNDQVTGPDIASPAVSLAPLTVAVYVVPYARGEVGVNVSVLVAEL